MNRLVMPIHQLRPDDVELMAMFGNILWSVGARPGLIEETQQVAETQRVRIFDELHAYYIQERPNTSMVLYGRPCAQPNYAMRVAAMADIVNAIDVGIFSMKEFPQQRLTRAKEDFNVVKLFDENAFTQRAAELIELVD